MKRFQFGLLDFSAITFPHILSINYTLHEILISLLHSLFQLIGLFHYKFILFLKSKEFLPLMFTLHVLKQVILYIPISRIQI